MKAGLCVTNSGINFKANGTDCEELPKTTFAVTEKGNKRTILTGGIKMLEVISRVVCGVELLTWIISFVCLKKHKVWEVIFSTMSICIFAIGFVELLCLMVGV